MQNYDFYSGKTARDFHPYFNNEDPEYFARLANINSKEESHGIKKASHLLSLIITLCIISFTVGIIIGIKFSSGEKNKQLVDDQTRSAVTDIGKKIAGMALDKSESAGQTERKSYSKEEFPYLIKIGKQYSKSKSQEIAGIISHHEQTVILSKVNGEYRIYTGPYRNHDEAILSLNQIKTSPINENAEIIKR